MIGVDKQGRSEGKALSAWNCEGIARKNNDFLRRSVAWNGEGRAERIKTEALNRLAFTSDGMAEQCEG